MFRSSQASEFRLSSPRFTPLTLKSLIVAMAITSMPTHAALYDGKSLNTSDLSDSLDRVRPGDIVIVAENHGYQPHHRNQIQALKALSSKLSNISVGMEFFSKPAQATVDSFLADNLTEAEFLKAISWSGIDFANYREQVHFPKAHQGKALALNAPRSLTSRIAKVGLAGLTQDERAQLPTGFALGNAKYKERFIEYMTSGANARMAWLTSLVTLGDESAADAVFKLFSGGHIPPEALDRYFEAQSTWDEFMSSTACEYIKANPEQTLLIIVGDFHAAYGGGLPDRLSARGCPNVTVFSQITASHFDQEDLLNEIRPHVRWGQRSDFIFVE